MENGAATEGRRFLIYYFRAFLERGPVASSILGLAGDQLVIQYTKCEEKKTYSEETLLQRSNPPWMQTHLCAAVCPNVSDFLFIFPSRWLVLVSCWT